MKNGVLWIIIVILALFLGFSVGYIVGDMRASQNITYSANNQDTNQEPVLSSDSTDITPSAVGSYQTDSWNGKSAALVLKADGTCLYPSGYSGTWTQDGTDITINLPGGSAIPAELVAGGVILATTFFEAVN